MGSRDNKNVGPREKLLLSVKYTGLTLSTSVETKVTGPSYEDEVHVYCVNTLAVRVSP